MSVPADAEIRRVLRDIHDPCSLAAGTPISIVDMGLVLGWEPAGPGALRVRMCVTAPGCTLAAVFMRAAEERLLALDGVDRVDVVLEDDGLWTEDRLSPAARRALEHRRAAVRSAARPRMWREHDREQETA